MTIDQDEEWTGARLVAHWVAHQGIVPEPAAYAIYRESIRPDAELAVTWLVANGTPRVLLPENMSAWMINHQLVGANRLALSVLLIRETLNEGGQIRECVLERRRGGIDGPLCGQPARVEFIGAARMARYYRVLTDGRLIEVTGEIDAAAPRRHASQQFAGEQKAVRERFGAGARVVEAREPILFEELVGINSVLHLRLPTGREIGCGIGWHGPLPFVLEADFPRFSIPLVLPSEAEAAVGEMIVQHDLIRHETRLDEQGLAVLARQRGGTALFTLRPSSAGVTVTPHQPGGTIAASEEQKAWLRYIETYENLTVLDYWQDSGTPNLLALTGEPNGQVWRHHIDREGVETWRRPDDDVAMAAVHMERLFPGTLASADSPNFETEPESDSDTEQTPDETRGASPDTLLAKAEAYVDALGIFLAIREAAASSAAQTGLRPIQVATRLRELETALAILGADRASAETLALLGQLERGQLRPGRFVNALTQVESHLLDELATIRLVTLPPLQWRYLVEAAPFGPVVESEFPGSAYDIEEAAFCLAYRRPTAAAFHCMRIIECGLEVLGQHLKSDLLGEDRLWSRILSTIRENTPPEVTGVAAALEQVRRTWRGSRLVHTEKYTEAEAERLFAAVGTLMHEIGTLPSLQRRSSV